MSLIVIYGINAAGKDSLANELKKKYSDAIFTSESRILMYSLGLIPSYDNSIKVNRESYKKLEDTPQEKMIEIENTIYKKIIEKISSEDSLTFLLTHLVFALNIDKEKPIYLTDRKVPDFIYQLGRAFIQILVHPKEILRRRSIDVSLEHRDRGVLTIEDIQYHQLLCSQRWDKLINNVGVENTLVVTNNQNELASAAVKVQEFIDQRIN